MIRKTAAALAAAAVVTAFAACGSEGGTAGVKPETAKASVERAAKLKLAVEQVPSDAREDGLIAAYSNSGTAVRDKQVVGLFVMKNATVAGKVGDLVRGTAPRGADLLVHDEVMVVYASAGKDRGKAIRAAVKEL